jgi:hypothetical protein
MIRPGSPARGSIPRHDGRDWGISDLFFRITRRLSFVSAARAPRSWTVPDIGEDATIQPACNEKSANFTAAIHGSYTITGSCTVTDPTPQSGHGYDCQVRNGTLTTSGGSYAAGFFVRRIYHSGAWLDIVIPSLATANTWTGGQTITGSTPSTPGAGEVRIGGGEIKTAGVITTASGAIYGTKTTALVTINVWVSTALGSATGLYVVRDVTNGTVGVYAVDAGLGTSTTILAQTNIEVRFNAGNVELRFVGGAARTMAPMVLSPSQV